uniref:Uncharacterized protein n=1 Tax=Panagrolaimus sp. JU765 TaxID=591449 RepID=A0AC34Q6N0_9BILA
MQKPEKSLGRFLDPAGRFCKNRDFSTSKVEDEKDKDSGQDSEGESANKHVFPKKEEQQGISPPTKRKLKKKTRIYEKTGNKKLDADIEFYRKANEGLKSLIAELDQELERQRCLKCHKLKPEISEKP